MGAARPSAKERLVTIATPAEVLAFLWRKPVVLTLLRGRKDIRRSEVPTNRGHNRIYYSKSLRTLTRVCALSDNLIKLVLDSFCLRWQQRMGSLCFENLHTAGSSDMQKYLVSFSSPMPPPCSSPLLLLLLLLCPEVWSYEAPEDKQDVFARRACPAFLTFTNAAYLSGVTVELPCHCKPQQVTHSH